MVKEYHKISEISQKYKIKCNVATVYLGIMCLNGIALSYFDELK